MSTSDACELCGRTGLPLTRHHLIPRAVHGRKRIRKRYNRERREGAILHVCRACHKQIHALCSAMELAERYASREALLAHPEMARFLRWIRTRPPGYVPRTRRRQR